MIQKIEKPKNVSDSFFGARMFYFFITLLILSITFIYTKNMLYFSFQNYDILFPITFFIIMIISFYLFLTTGDYPGYLNIEEIKNSENSIININNNEIESIDPVKKYERFNEIDNKTQELVENNINNSPKERLNENNNHDDHQSDNFKFCEICKKEKFLRMKHCDKCERCVHKYDHHCFWIGACVGELNHGKFWTFLFFQTITNLIGFLICFDALDYYDYYSIVSENDKLEKVYSSEYGAFFVCSVISFLFVLFTGVLLGYHTFLICTNQTTWEHNRRERITYIKDYPINIYPFSEGFFNNIKMVFWNKNQIRNWKTRTIENFPESQRNGFNICENEYYSCC